MGEVVKAVENVGREIGKGAENITREASKGLTLTGQVVGNVGNLVGGDVGKGINAITAPTGAFIQSGGDILKGDIKGAVARQTGAMLAAGSAPLSASSSLKDLARNDTVNAFTLGFSNDISEVNDSSRRMITSGEIRDSDLSAMGRLGVRTALAVGTMGAVNAAGGVSGMGSAAVNAGKSGVGFLQSAGTAIGGAAGIASIAKDPVKAGATYLGFDKQLDQIRNVEDTIKGVVSQPASNRTPAATPTTTNAVSTTGTSNLSSMLPVFAIAGAALLALIFILKRK